MATSDISRAVFDPRKHYASVRMQQGRVIVDDDWNENECIESEDRRRSRVEIVGPAGSPDNGFRVENASWSNSRIDFDIQPGAFYLGGLRLQLEEKQTYRRQSDWLQWPGNRQDGPPADRVDLVYLEAYQEPVGAVEDSELLEVALGGPDTSMRIRTVQRVHLLKDVAADCARAWQELGQKLPGSLNDRNELETDAALTVTFKPGGTADDLCTPAVAGGYLGAENQAIRVQLVTASSFTWGFDNASSLYRVSVAADRKTVSLVTEPKDQAHWPLSGQIVEILPWGAVLPNGEKAAEVQGHLTSVDTSYNPDTRKLTLRDAVPTDGFDDWTFRAADKADLEKPHDPEQPGVYYFMRVWDRGSDRSSAPAIPFSAAPVDLGHTGLQVTIKGLLCIPGDHWIIAARPQAPDEVVPWGLSGTNGRRPHGVRRFYAPLALIQWKSGQAKGEVHDCRRTFRPLTGLKTCCTLTVGDGKASQGDFDSLAEALQHLPPSGGQICLLPGVHEANLVIQQRSNVRISGCEGRTLVIPGPSTQSPIFHIKDSQGITLETMDLATLEGSAIVLEGSEPGQVADIEVRHNRILAYRNAIRVMQGARVHIHHNKIRMLDKEGGDVAIFILADDGLIERNDVLVVPAGTLPPPVPGEEETPDPADPCAMLEAILADRRYLRAYLYHAWALDLEAVPANPFLALGGIQIGSGSERIGVLVNCIRGGAGNGITLGSDFDISDMPPGGAQPEAAPQVASSAAGTIRGRVTFRGRPAVGGTPLVLYGTTGTPLTAVTDSAGEFVISDVPPGTAYRVFVSAPDYKIGRVESGDVYRIHLGRGEPRVDLADVLAFIYDVSIHDNCISGMGLSGIGIPHFDLAQLGDLQKLREISAAQPQWALLFLLAYYFGILNGFAVNLSIQQNHICDCLQSPIVPGQKAALVGRGVGGISLGLCENLLINENRIEGNGAGQSNPVCGIFVLFADQVEMGQNHVLGNGTAGKETLAGLRPGLRGGIVVLLATCLAVTSKLAPLHGGAVARGGYAARIHDNVVSQPVGRGLTLGAFGPAAVVDNRFQTGMAGPGTLDTLVGAVLILNLGGVQELLAGRLDVAGAETPAAGAEEAEQPEEGSPGMWTGRVAYRPPARVGVTQPHPYFPNGDTLFSNNQAELGAGRRAAVSHLILTAGDLGFLGNQCRMLATNQRKPQVDSLLGGMTLRASGNRLTEIVDRDASVLKLSLLTVSLLMNNTTHNQGNHCTVAVSLWEAGLPSLSLRVSGDNQALVSSADGCRSLEDSVAANPALLWSGLAALLRR